MDGRSNRRNKAGFSNSSVVVWTLPKRMASSNVTSESLYWLMSNCLKLYFAFVSRYLTFFYYLKEPKLGGETAFPIADNETIPQNHVSYFS